MFKSHGVRSSALARAQAQLSGQRIPMAPKDTNEELQEYMNALNKKTSVLKHKQAPVPGMSDLSDASIDDLEIPNNTGDQGYGKPPQASVGQSRFLKKKQHVDESTLPLQSQPDAGNGLMPSPNVTRAGTSMIRSSAALKKLAQIESKIRNRALEAEASDADSDLRTSDERPFSARSSSDMSGRGNRFLKKNDVHRSLQREDVQDPMIMNTSYVNQRKAGVKTVVTLESEEEEIKRLVGSSVEFSDENESWWKLRPKAIPGQSFGTTARTKRTPSPPTKGSPRQTVYRSASLHNEIRQPRGPSRLSSRTPTPPSRGTPRHYRRARSLSRSTLSSVRSSLNSNSSPRFKLSKRSRSRTPLSGRSRTPLSGRSDIKSLDELFSRSSLADNVASDSSAEFKVNILSLDDLAPNMQLDTPRQLEKEPKTKEKSTTKEQKKVIMQALQDPEKPTRHRTERSLEVTQKVTQDTDSASEIPTETDDDLEISEHLTLNSTPRARIRFSAPAHTPSLHGESTARSAYSDDFEKSTQTALSKDTDSEITASHTSSLSDHSRKAGYSSSLTAKSPAQASHSQPEKRRGGANRRATVKEASVQTNDPAFIYHWSNLNGSAVLAPALGAAYTDPVPIASHVVSPDAVEAMTAYSPAVFALNDMLKQQLMLTQQFVEMSRHLHLATLDSLEDDSYHYITLEETKEYIRRHKPSSLTRKPHFEDSLLET
ncbi:uncharacterized protein C19orf44 homolog isoform X2 [Ambystoma mexicanum]